VTTQTTERLTKTLEADGTLAVYSVILKDGEEYKTLEEVQKVCCQGSQLMCRQQQ
jgi:3-dehydroquinate synthetase